MHNKLDLFRQKAGWLRISLKFYEKREVPVRGFHRSGDAGRYFALSGGLMTGILPPVSGGGTFISEPALAGGQMTPFDSESLVPSCALSLPPSAGVHCCEGDGGDGGGVCACAKAAVPIERQQHAAANRISSFPARPA